MPGRGSRWRSLITALVALGAACGGSAPPDAPATALDDDAITVASFDFPESALLAELYGQALEAGGYPVTHARRVGPRELVQPALAQGLVELVPEYAGTALRFLGADDAPPPGDPTTAHAALVRALEGSPVVALASAPAEDTNTFVVTRLTADRLGLRDLSDLAGVAEALTFGGPAECRSRALCLEGLRRVYGVTFEEVLALDAGGPLTHTALDDGYVDVALLFSTDPALAGGDLVALPDVRSLQPAENVTPLLRQEVVARWGPAVVARLDRVSALLTTEELRALNAEVAAGATTTAAAGAWLAARGLR